MHVEQLPKLIDTFLLKQKGYSSSQCTTRFISLSSFIAGYSGSSANGFGWIDRDHTGEVTQNPCSVDL